ncbi:MAG TPA: DUF1559 domain-containing protein [Phycisphaerales bacterium]|nr:DUF1559 domain-containing protein [Phycisphaerales bacterium]
MRRSRTRAFTIVEILVVLAIIALLMGLLMPALMSVRASGRATKSMSNLRQWGLAMTMYANLYKETFPYEGRKNANQMAINFSTTDWWANALPQFVGEKPYRELHDQAVANGSHVPMPPDSTSIFIDPAAVAPLDAPYVGQGREFFFCYVPNSQLNNTLQLRMESNGMSSTEAQYRARMRMNMMRQPEKTIFMVEMRTDKSELYSDDPHYDRLLNRHRSDWKRFAARHFRGGHMLFADAHVGHVLNEIATTNVQGTRDPGEPNGDWNTTTLTWDPLGPATDED